MIRFFKIVVFVSLIVGFSNFTVLAGNLDMFKVTDTIPIKNINKNKIFKAAMEWMQKEKNTKLLRSNPEEFVVEGKGFLLYYNHVVMEDVFLSPRAGERTNGTIVRS